MMGVVDFEHEECPRYMFARTEDAAISFFTDPTKPPTMLRLDDIIPAFWANIGEPDNVHFPPFLVAGSGAALDLLRRSRMLPNVLSHLERLSENSNVVFVQLANDAAQRKIEPIDHGAGGQNIGPADLVFLPTRLVQDVIHNNALDWFASIGSQHGASGCVPGRRIANSTRVSEPGRVATLAAYCSRVSTCSSRLASCTSP